ncbi:hypothetical protein HDU97_000416 [Phlyctochytrium planicorne]|nr:hypothetical protein HDU97_000416 [Phlyctochytrium planicorne]
MRVHILGAGAIGLLNAHHLCKHNIPVTLLLRTQEALHQFIDPLLKTGTIRVDTPKPTPTSSPLHLQPHTWQVPAECIQDPTSTTPIDHLLVTTKAQDTLPALKTLLQTNRLKKDTPIILLQNGVMAVAEQVLNLWVDAFHPSKPDSTAHLCSLLRDPDAKLVPNASRPNLILGSITHGVTKEERFWIKHVGDGEVVLGSPFASDGVRNALEVWKGLEGFGVKVLEPGEGWDDMRKRLMIKLAVNATLNPLTALTTALNGDLLSPPLLPLLELLIDDITPLLCPTYTTPSNLRSTILSVAEKTRFNRNSMEVDVDNGRDTEVEYIVGDLVRMAERRGVRVKGLEMVRGLVLGRVESLRRRERGREKL